MNFNRYTRRVDKALKIAREYSSKTGYEVTGSGHVLWALMCIGDGTAYNVLSNMGLELEDIKEDLDKIMECSSYEPLEGDAENKEMSPRMKNILEVAEKIANSYHTNFIASEHLLFAMTGEEGCVANIILKNREIDIDILKKLILDKENKKEEKFLSYIRANNEDYPDEDSDLPVLNKYGINMIKYVKENSVDPLLGRDEEIKRIMQILNRRKKNNPVLIGEPGVGKTAIVEGIARGLAFMSYHNDELFHKKMYSLEIGSLIAGTKYRGDFEERLQNIIDEVSNSDEKILLFIDEMHTLVGAGSSGEKGSVDASNILKPALSRGSVQIIGATTIDEYRMHIEKDPALERRFQPVKVSEPDRDTSVYILKGIRDKYEAYHKVKITDEAIEKAVDLSIRYIADRFLPDKAIDLIDESCSRVKLKSRFLPSTINDMEKMEKQLEKQLEEVIADQNFEAAIDIKKKKNELVKDIKRERVIWNKRRDNKNTVTGEVVAEVVEMWTGIPINKIMEEEAERLLNLENVLKERVVGQEHAEKEVARAIRRSRTGVQDPKRPIGSFLFVGPPGVGKTELSIAIAESLFLGEQNIIRVDMSEYMEKHSVSKIIGSPPGYVGHEEGGYLTEKVRFNPYSVILFDEIEKAHIDVLNILLQMLDDGILTDSKGRTVDFKNTIIIMTSNIGYKSSNEVNMGFSASKAAYSEDEIDLLDKKARERTLNDVASYFTPELLNRIDDIIVFRSLRKSDFEKIVVILSKTLIERTKDIGIDLEISDSIYKHIAELAAKANQGARPVNRLIQHKLTNKVSEAVLKKTIAPGDKVLAYFSNGEVEFKKH
ncbi:MAG: ATP-dependent Clp protease ATP-binding subunit [Peptostreptococcus sp.]|uniref:ATP-dependent Clp protease ATP-binding subunit n=1 Tax=Peptostreptococcus sp. TaxID=1262 RepID=UPI002FC5BA5C